MILTVNLKVLSGLGNFKDFYELVGANYLVGFAGSKILSERVGVWPVPRDASKNSAAMVNFIRIEIVRSLQEVHVSIL
jgi:hypothetical protein